jgi:hypothetical protein
LIEETEFRQEIHVVRLLKMLFVFVRRKRISTRNSCSGNFKSSLLFFSEERDFRQEIHVVRILKLSSFLTEETEFRPEIHVVRFLKILFASDRRNRISTRNSCSKNFKNPLPF